MAIEEEVTQGTTPQDEAGAAPELLIPDASSYQGEPDWERVKHAGFAGGITKATEGTAVHDPQYARNWRELNRLEMWRAAYGLTRFDLGTTPKDEAAYFLARVAQQGPLNPYDALILDLETGSGDLSRPALLWLEHVENDCGFPPLLYSYLDFIMQHLRDPALARYPLFLALYNAPTPRSVPPWTEVALHQFTDKASVPGIAGEVDCSRIARDLDGLRALGKPVPAPPNPSPFRWARMTTAQHLRAQPRADSARGVLLVVGTVLPIIGPPTPHWVRVRTTSGPVEEGWVLLANVERFVIRPKTAGRFGQKETAMGKGEGTSE